MPKPIFLLDVDGVICDFLSKFVATANKHLNRNYTLEMITEWDINKALGLTQEEEDLVYSQVNAAGWCFSLSPYPGAVDAVSELRKFCDVYAVTAPMRGPHWAGERLVWLRTFFGFDTKHIWQGKEKWMLHGDFFLDDRPSSVIAWSKAHPKGKAMLWSTPYNTKAQVLITQDTEGGGEPYGSVAKYWREVLEIIQR